MNDAVRRSEAATFCTLVYGELVCRPDGAVLTVANGGHPSPVVVPAGGLARVTGHLGPLVGVFEDPAFRQETIELAAGDTVVLYTDGVTDLPPPDAVDEPELLAMVEDAVRNAADADEMTSRLSAALDRRTDKMARTGRLWGSPRELTRFVGATISTKNQIIAALAVLAQRFVEHFGLGIEIAPAEARLPTGALLPGEGARVAAALTLVDGIQAGAAGANALWPALSPLLPAFSHGPAHSSGRALLDQMAPMVRPALQRLSGTCNPGAGR